jgi:hypothetical protein
MKGTAILSILLCANIALSSYVIYLASNFQSDVRLVKDAWNVATKVKVARQGYDWVKNKLEIKDDV